jgi:hypothetical protein
MMACTGFISDWQTLIAGAVGGVIGGGLTVVAGWITLKGAREQVASTRDAREESDRRRLSVVKWAVKAEGRRLGTAAAIMRAALPSSPQPAARSREQLIIASSSLLRGEREDIALLDDETRGLLEKITVTLDAYNLRIATANTNNLGPHIDERTLELITEVEKLAAELRARS